MAKRRKWVWIAAVGLAGLVVAGALLVPALIDVERYRGRIEAALKQATGWDAQLGQIEFSVWHGMVLAVHPAILAAPGDASRFEIERLEIRSELWPLLRGELNIRAIDLVAPDLRLVRDASGWVLPVAPGETTGASRDEPARFAVQIDTVRIRDGKLRIADRAGDPPLTIGLDDLDVDVTPASGELEGSAALAEGGGRIAWHGNWAERLTVELDGVRTELLHPFLGTDLVHGGGTISGTIDLGFPLALEAELRGNGISLLAGTRPFDEFRLETAARADGERWLLERLRMEADSLVVEGSGELMPRVDLGLRLPTAPLDVALRASESILPLPLELEPPGSVEADLTVRQPEGRPLTYTARGKLAAARFLASDMLPPATDVRADFDLDREGRLEIRIVEGKVAGGPVTGVARLSSIHPPGRLTFDGGLRDAVFGGLLSGLVGDSVSKIEGPTGLDARLGLDLGRPQIDARAISGRLDLGSRAVALPGWDLEGAIRRKIDEKLAGLDLGSLVEKKLGRSGTAAAETAARALDSLEASVDFDRWPWKLEKLSLEAGDLSARGDGTFNPESGEVDLRFAARLNAEKTAELVKKTKELRPLVDADGKLSLPLQVNGSLVSPSIHVDLGKALSTSSDEVKETVRDKLKGLLERKR